MSLPRDPKSIWIGITKLLGITQGTEIKMVRMASKHKLRKRKGAVFKN